MRVSTARVGKEILDEEEATQPQQIICKLRAAEGILSASCAAVGNRLVIGLETGPASASASGRGSANHEQRPVPVGPGRVGGLHRDVKTARC